ncbi:hypothetical protein [Nocardioides terrigena]|uniref:hypothetical protein n=1 Tax=Nocardioides terrigena TaxID=424797 RepID=UPI000D303623|nr:hypothetical protein [Nocardioides terrigena]
MSETSVPPPRLATGPLSLPPNPMQSASANRDTVLEIRELVLATMEKAMADQAASMEAVAAAAAGATGEGLDGAVQVRVDGKGLIAGASFGPEIIGLTPEELRGETLAALEDAKGRLGLSPLRAGDLADLDTRPVADAIMNLLLGKESGA